MGKLSAQTLIETETVIRFDETDDPAVLWTASPKVRKEWESYGFKTEIRGGGWRTIAPKDRISYKTLKNAKE